VTYKQLTVQGALALAGLLAAYFTWQRGIELAPGEVLVVDIGKNDLVGVRYEDREKSTWVELERMTDEAGSFTSVHLGPQEKPAVGAKPPVKTPERLVRGSDASEKSFGNFAPLRASRGLGNLDAEKLKALGLDTTQKRILLKLRNGTRTFTIAPAPPGGSDPYLRDETSGQVFIVGRSILSDFSSAASLLVERKVHAFRLEEADRMVATFGGTPRDYAITKGEDGVRLAPKSSPDKPDSALKTWHDRVFGVWPMEMLGKDEIPAEGTPQVELRIDYTLRGRRLGFIEIGKVPAVASSNDSTKDTLFVRSERTLGWAKLGPDGQTLLADAKTNLH
jgi:hypothetical protein